MEVLVYTHFLMFFLYNHIQYQHLYLFFGDSELARFSPSEYTQV